MGRVIKRPMTDLVTDKDQFHTNSNGFVVGKSKGKE
jgi:hypothetical protein